MRSQCKRNANAHKKTFNALMLNNLQCVKIGAFFINISARPDFTHYKRTRAHAYSIYYTSSLLFI